jgi:hypothetical protein
MAVQGPLARSAEDLALALDIVAGPEVGEDAAWRLALPPARHDRLVDYRVAVMPPIDWAPADDEILAALDRLATGLGRLGVTVKEIQPAALGDMRDYFRLRMAIGAVMDSIGRPAAERMREAQEIRENSDLFYDRAWADGLVASASDYIIWFGRREHYRAAFRRFFEDWDVPPRRRTVARAHAGCQRAARRLRPAERLPVPVQSDRPPRYRVSGRPDPLRTTHRLAGRRTLSRGSHPHPLCRAAGRAVRRLSPPAGIRLIVYVAPGYFNPNAPWRWRCREIVL